ncbi:Short-chain dehydrogenase TIC 32 [Diplonema papillatum]|nr:Short-chain dehydrogenase TIC 32 [Diplonema papillatum]|eukprot:gene17331-26619_t
MPVVYELLDLTNKVYVVTGANAGLGLESSTVFARQGAHVVMACRNMEKAGAALKIVQAAAKDAGKGSAEIMHLDLSSLDSVAAFAKELAAKHKVVHCLLNNAGVMNCPLTRTKDGFEMQMGTNHFGHFALTMRLLPLLKRAEQARIVNVSSIAAMSPVGIHWSDINCERSGYNGWLRYCASKLANLIFSHELQRKLKETGVDNITVLMAHPGMTSTELERHTSWMPYVSWMILSPVSKGAKSQIYAAAGAKVAPLEYYGPSMYTSGEPSLTNPGSAAKSEANGEKLWKISEELTKETFPSLKDSAL